MNDHYAAFPLYTRDQVLALKTESIDPVALIDLLAQTTASEDTKILGQDTYEGLLKTATYRRRLESAAAARCAGLPASSGVAAATASISGILPLQ